MGNNSQSVVDYSASEMFYNACSFADCGELCRKGTQERNSIFLSNPMIVNYALSCELFLKILLVIYKLPPSHSHKLNDLYKELPSKVQSDIELEMIYRVGKLTDIWGCSLLEQMSNAFVDWRYIYEKIPNKTSSMIINTGFLTSFCEVLRNICCMCIFNISYDEYVRKT